MRRLHVTLLCSTMLMGAFGLAQVAPSVIASPAAAQQVTIKAEFRTALEPYGRFERHARYGEVWRPAKIAKGWRPYTEGRWVYTDDWGWYWNAADTEANWGWVAYHYGRWVNDAQMGWVWVPGDQWGPAWVSWRRGDRQKARYVGWAPLPPDDVVVDVRDDPDWWIFVRAQDIVAPRISRVIVKQDLRHALLRETVVVNRTVIVRDRNVIVNPGIAPAFVAAVMGRPLRAYEVRPRVFVGTTNVRGAIEIRADDLRDRRRLERDKVVIRETKTTIAPAKEIAQPRALEANEQGRLGDRPPRAARAEGDRDEQRMGDRNERREMREGRDQRRDGQKEGATAQDDKKGATGRAGKEGATARGSDETSGDKPGRSASERGKPSTDKATAEKDASPGKSGAAPGRDRANDRSKERGPASADKDASPGKSGAAPGRERANERSRERGPASADKDASPGKSGAAPGRERANERSRERGPASADKDASPGKSGAAPGRERANERSQERGAVTGATPGAKPSGAAPSGAAPGKPAATPGGKPDNAGEARGRKKPGEE